MKTIFLLSLIFAQLLPLILSVSFGGDIDLEGLDTAKGTSTMTLSFMGDRYGESVASCDFNKDGTPDVIIGVPKENMEAGGIYIAFGGSNLAVTDFETFSPGLTTGYKVKYTGTQQFGIKVACLGDLDGDGADDIGILDATKTVLIIFYGSETYIDSGDIDIIDVGGGSFRAKIFQTSGSPLIEVLDLIPLGDINGDDAPEFALQINDLQNGYPAVLVYYDPAVIAANTLGDLDAHPGAFKIWNSNQDAGRQITVASAGNFHSDTYADIAIGNLNNGDQAAIIFGKGSAWSDIDLGGGGFTTSQVVFINGDSTYSLGESIAYAADVNGDHRDDIIIGAPGYDGGNGAAFVITGAALFNTDIDVTNSPTSGGYLIKHSTVTGRKLGSAVYGGLSFDLSGTDSTVVACDDITTTPGSCYVVFQAVLGGTGTTDVDTIESEEGFAVQMSTSLKPSNLKFINAGDANSDGYPDLIIGAPDAVAEDGVAYLLYGPNYCKSPCKTCSGLGSSDWSKCVTCEAGSDYLFEDFCYSTCPIGSFLPAGATFECSACDSNCYGCDTLATTCISCKASGSAPYLYGDVCFASCPSNTYADASKTCQTCDANCLECDTAATKCTSCDTTGSAPYLSSGVCYAQCPSNTAADATNICIEIPATTIEVPEAVKTFSSAEQANKVSNEVMSTISSLGFGGVHSIRSQSIQGPMSYFIFMNVKYPSNYGQFAKSNFGSSSMPNPFKNTGKSSSSSRLLEESSETVVGNGRVESVNLYLDNQTLLANIGYSVLFLAACLLLIPINDMLLAVITSKKKDCESKWYHKLLTRGSVSFRWSFLINQFVSKYQDLAFFSFLGLYNAGDQDDFDTLNLVVCIFGFLIVMAGLVALFFIIRNITRELKKLTEEEKEKEEYKKNDFLGRRLVLYKELKKDRLMTTLYPFFLMIRVFGFNFVTIFLCNQVAIQLVFLNLYAVLMLFYLFKYRPLEERGQLVMTIAYEVDAFVALLGVTLLQIYNTAGGTSEHTQSVFGYFIIVANVAMMILNFISFYLEIQDLAILLYENAKIFYQKYKAKKVGPQGTSRIDMVQSKEPFFMSPTSSFMQEKRPGTPEEGSPSVMPEVQSFDHDESPGLPSPSNMSRVLLNPLSPVSQGERLSMNEKLGLIKLESGAEIRKNSTQKRFSKATPNARESVHIPVEEFAETDTLV